ncbi:MAG: hypothetical protein GY788_12335 [bacterium]|nr:hypothetical protein [bacterium]
MIDGFGANDIALVTVMYLGITAVGIFRATGYPNSQQLDEWMEGHGLNPQASTRSVLARYLNRTRWIRTIGALIGWNVPYVWMWVTRSARRMDELGNFWWLGGFALGIVVAELVRPRFRGTGSAMEQRRLAQYLPDFTRLDTWILVGLAVLPALAAQLVPTKGVVWPNDSAIAREDITWYLWLGAASVAIVVVTRAIQEVIVRRRQSFDDLDELQADDAMRSTSIQGIAGLGYGGPLFMIATMSWDLALTTSSPGSWAFVVLSYGAMAAGVGMLFGFPRLNTKWTVPRARTS